MYFSRCSRHSFCSIYYQYFTMYNNHPGIRCPLTKSRMFPSLRYRSFRSGYPYMLHSCPSPGEISVKPQEKNELMGAMRLPFEQMLHICFSPLTSLIATSWADDAMVNQNLPLCLATGSNIRTLARLTSQNLHLPRADRASRPGSPN